MRLPGGSLRPFFSLRGESIRDRTQAADPFADFHEFMTELSVVTEFGNLLFGLAHAGRCRQRLRYGLAAHLVGEAQGGPVAGVIGLRTVTTRFTTAKHGANDGAGAHIFEVGDGAKQLRAAGFQSGKRFGQVAHPISAALSRQIAYCRNMGNTTLVGRSSSGWRTDCVLP